MFFRIHPGDPVKGAKRLAQELGLDVIAFCAMTGAPVAVAKRDAEGKVRGRRI